MTDWLHRWARPRPTRDYFYSYGTRVPARLSTSAPTSRASSADWLAAIAALFSAGAAVLLWLVTTRYEATTARIFSTSVAPYMFPALTARPDLNADLLYITTFIANAGHGPALHFEPKTKIVVRQALSADGLHFRYFHAKTAQFYPWRPLSVVETVGPGEKQTIARIIDRFGRLASRTDRAMVVVQFRYRSVAEHRYCIRKKFEYNSMTNRFDIVGGSYSEEPANGGRERKCPFGKVIPGLCSEQGSDS